MVLPNVVVSDFSNFRPNNLASGLSGSTPLFAISSLALLLEIKKIESTNKKHIWFELAQLWLNHEAAFPTAQPTLITGLRVNNPWPEHAY